MPAVLTEDPIASIDVALAEMELRAERRQRLSSHLELCGECDEVLCAAGDELMREALR